MAISSPLQLDLSTSEIHEYTESQWFSEPRRVGGKCKANDSAPVARGELAEDPISPPQSPILVYRHRTIETSEIPKPKPLPLYDPSLLSISSLGPSSEEKSVTTPNPKRARIEPSEAAIPIERVMNETRILSLFLDGKLQGTNGIVDLTRNSQDPNSDPPHTLPHASVSQISMHTTQASALSQATEPIVPTGVAKHSKAEAAPPLAKPLDTLCEFTGQITTNGGMTLVCWLHKTRLSLPNVANFRGLWLTSDGIDLCRMATTFIAVQAALPISS